MGYDQYARAVSYGGWKRNSEQGSQVPDADGSAREITLDVRIRFAHPDKHDHGRQNSDKGRGDKDHEKRHSAPMLLSRHGRINEDFVSAKELTLRRLGPTLLWRASPGVAARGTRSFAEIRIKRKWQENARKRHTGAHMVPRTRNKRV